MVLIGSGVPARAADASAMTGTVLRQGRTLAIYTLPYYRETWRRSGLRRIPSPDHGQEAVRVLAWNVDRRSFPPEG
ncbi:hypothetical protein AB0L53_38855 [Nonomuraea sp. NPDC052129]|uniref:hypothetical protein n=1 Tax=Nonomuraea sp. NPDC052129 TaxID=3154651 RepID=UPI003422F27C